MDLNPRVIDTAGRELYTVGGESAHSTGTYKGYCWSLEWFVGNRTTEPMLAIWPSIQWHESNGVWGICLSSAGKFAGPDGKPTAECHIEASIALRDTFNRVPLGVDVRTLVDVVMHKLPDLILMPPTPRRVRLEAKRRALWDVALKQNGKTVQEVSI
jgi:hypothetical protein